jgi:hypothetical protein
MSLEIWCVQLRAEVRHDDTRLFNGVLHACGLLSPVCLLAPITCLPLHFVCSVQRTLPMTQTTGLACSQGRLCCHSLKSSKTEEQTVSSMSGLHRTCKNKRCGAVFRVSSGA